jgi:hypothetical protein
MLYNVHRNFNLKLKLGHHWQVRHACRAFLFAFNAFPFSRNGPAYVLSFIVHHKVTRPGTRAMLFSLPSLLLPLPAMAPHAVVHRSQLQITMSIARWVTRSGTRAMLFSLPFESMLSPLPAKAPHICCRSFIW